MASAAVLGSAAGEGAPDFVHDRRLPAFRGMERLVKAASRPLAAVCATHEEAESLVREELAKDGRSALKPVEDIRAEFSRLAALLPEQRAAALKRAQDGELEDEEAATVAAAESDLDAVLSAVFPVAATRDAMLRGASIRDKASLLLAMGVLRPPDIALLALASEGAECRAALVDRGVTSAVTMLQGAMQRQARAAAVWPPPASHPQWSPAQGADPATLDVAVPACAGHPLPRVLAVGLPPSPPEPLPESGARTCSSLYAGYSADASATAVGGTGGYSPATADVLGEWIRVPLDGDAVVWGVRLRGTPHYWPEAVSLVVTLCGSAEEEELCPPEGEGVGPGGAWFPACTEARKTADCMLAHPLNNVSSVKVVIRASHSWCQMQVSVLGRPAVA